MVKVMNDNGAKKTIMIVDDSKFNQDMLTEILGVTYRYLYADDGLEAVEILNTDARVDVLLLDINMPQMDGFEVLRIMNEKHWIDEIPVVVVSSESQSELIDRTFELGAIDCITRPFRASVVQHRVENSLKLYMKQRNLTSLVKSQLYEREKTNNMMIQILSHMAENRNHESGDHTLHIQNITNLLLHQLMRISDDYHLSQTEISRISTVSALHDIGKMSVPEEILNKPGKLTSEEWEIMKAHTVRGDEFIQSMKGAAEEPVMIVAHEICRWHHERWDGKGYPDGLKGDEIPISAQAVSVADVYDALTSDRCYKKAYTHEEALRMICDGECGCFNPVLLQALNDISDELLLNLELNIQSNYDYQTETSKLASEILEEEEVGQADRSYTQLEIERIKKLFFSEQCRGIQFEYDSQLQKVLYLTKFNELGEKLQLSSEAIKLLDSEDLQVLNKRIHATTPENPTVVMTVLVPIDGEKRWQKLTAMTIWLAGQDEYVGVVGHFSDIHHEILQDDTEDIVTLNQRMLRNFYRDAVTTAYSRIYLEDFYEKFETADAVAVVDIDRFKYINDTYGHMVGDKALKSISEALSSSIRKEDTMIRYGGDEFLIVFEKIGAKDFDGILKRLKSSVHKISIEEHPDIVLNISVGGAYKVSPLSDAIHHADKEMYKDKAKHWRREV